MSDIVDLTRIQETSDGDLEFERELIEMYLEDSKVHVETLIGHLETGNEKGARTVAHTLKGSSSNVGAMTLHEVSAQMEKAAHDGQIDVAKSLIPSLNTQFEAVSGFFNDYLKKIS